MLSIWRSSSNLRVQAIHEHLALIAVYLARMAVLIRSEEQMNDRILQTTQMTCLYSYLWFICKQLVCFQESGFASRRNTYLLNLHTHNPSFISSKRQCAVPDYFLGFTVAVFLKHKTMSHLSSFDNLDIHEEHIHYGFLLLLSLPNVLLASSWIWNVTSTRSYYCCYVDVSIPWYGFYAIQLLTSRVLQITLELL